MSENHESKQEPSVAMDEKLDTASSETTVPETPTINDDVAVSDNDAVTEPRKHTTTSNGTSESANTLEGGTTKDVKSDAKAALSQLPTIEDEDTSGGTEPIALDEVGNTTNDLQQEAIKAMAMKAERERLEREKAEEDAKRGVFEAGMILRLDAVDTTENGQPITLEVAGDLTVGRADNVTDYTPEIDLTPHGAYRLGLSRRHALIRRNAEGLLVKDLSSRNGTFVNGEQVGAGETHPIRDGDELRFGNLAMRVSFQQK